MLDKLVVGDLVMREMEGGAMIEKYDTEKAGVVVFWQEPKSPDTIGEPAISMKAYSDCLVLTQGKGQVNVTLECVPEFIRAVKKAMEEA